MSLEATRAAVLARAAEGARAVALAQAVALGLGAGPAAAAPPGDLAGAPPGASTCSGCHGAGAPAPGAILPPLAGRPAAELAAIMAEYRTGAREGTLMGRIAKGFTEPETQAIAEWLSRSR